jgi:hypothetical protein
MSVCLFAAAFSFYIPSDQTAHIGLIAFFLFVFAALYSPGMGPMPFTVASEAFPLSHREVGVAVSVGLNLFFAALLTLFYPRINSALNDTGSLCLFAGFNLVAAVLVFLFLPETKQRSLEELDLVFAVPIAKFMKYQFQIVLPWAAKRYVLGRKDELDDLYHDRIWDSNLWEKGARMQEMQDYDIGRNTDTLDLGKPDMGGETPATRDWAPTETAPDQRIEEHVERSHHDVLRQREDDTVSISSSVGTHD